MRGHTSAEQSRTSFSIRKNECLPLTQPLNPTNSDYECHQFLPAKQPETEDYCGVLTRIVLKCCKPRANSTSTDKSVLYPSGSFGNYRNQ